MFSAEEVKENKANPEFFRIAIGEAAEKTSGKPFLGGNPIGIICDVGVHPYRKGWASYLMDDGSWVECFRCKII